MEHDLFYGNVHYISVCNRVCPGPSVFQGIQAQQDIQGPLDGVLAGSCYCICLCMEMDICRGWFRYLKLVPDPAAYCEGAGFLADHGTGGHDSSYHYEYLERRSL